MGRRVLILIEWGFIRNAYETSNALKAPGYGLVIKCFRGVFILTFFAYCRRVLPSLFYRCALNKNRVFVNQDAVTITCGE